MAASPLPHEHVEYARSPDGSVARRLLHGNTGIVLAGERYFPLARAWWLESAVLDEKEFPTISADEARAMFPDALDLVNADRPAGRKKDPARLTLSRLAWLDVAIETTWKVIDEDSIGSLRELPLASPGTRDYDYEIDKTIAIAAAYRTLEALCAERRAIEWGVQTRRERKYDE